MKAASCGATISSCLVLLLAGSSVKAEEPQVEIVAPQHISLGRVVRMRATLARTPPPLKVVFSWSVTERAAPTNDDPVGADLEVWPDGSRASFGSGLTPTLVEVEVTAAMLDGDQLEIAKAKTLIAIGPPGPVPPGPVPPGPVPVPIPVPIPIPQSGYGRLVFDKLKESNLSKVETTSLLTAYDKLISQIASNQLTTKQDIITATQQATQQALKSYDYQKWINCLLEPLRQALNKHSASLTDTQKLLGVYQEIRTGLAAWVSTR